MRLASVGKGGEGLELVWEGGARASIPHAEVRARCRCAECQGARLRTGKDPVVDPAVRLLDILPVGAFALQFIFSDGHERGIYPFEYLAAWR